MGDHLFDLGLAQVRQMVWRRLGHEILEIAGIVVDFEMLVQQVVVGDHLEQFGLGLEDFAKSALCIGNVGDEVDDGPRLLNPLGGGGTGAGMKVHGVADDLAHLPAWIAVVTDIGNALLRECGLADTVDGVADKLRDPAIDAVTDNIIEFAIFGGVVGCQVCLAQLNVFQTQAGDFLLPLLHLDP